MMEKKSETTQEGWTLEEDAFWCPAERPESETRIAFEEFLEISRVVFDPKQWKPANQENEPAEGEEP